MRKGRGVKRKYQANTFYKTNTVKGSSMILPCAQKYLITITANSEDLFWCQLRQQSPYYIMSLNLRDVLCRTHQKSSLLILSLNRYLATFTLMYSTEEKLQCFSFKVEENECVLIFSILVFIFINFDC